MPYSHPEKRKELRRLSKRKTQGYRRSARSQEFQEKYPNTDLSILTQQEREGIERYYLQVETLAQIAEDWGLSRERVRQIIENGIKKLSLV